MTMEINITSFLLCVLCIINIYVTYVIIEIEQLKQSSFIERLINILFINKNNSL